MSRISYSFLLGSVAIIMYTFPSIINADFQETVDDIPQGKIVGNQLSKKQKKRNARKAYREASNNQNQFTTYGGYQYYDSYGYPNSYGAYDNPNNFNSYFYSNNLNTYSRPYDYSNSMNSYYNNYNYSTGINPYDGAYDYNYPSSYSTYPIYPNSYSYSGYRPYPMGNMYNPNTVFVNPPSSLNSPRYPVYTEHYIYR